MCDAKCIFFIAANLGLVMRLSFLRQFFNAPWLIVVSALLYGFSQASLASIFARMGAANFLNMQVSFFSADDYLRFFAELNSLGLLEVYASHLQLDHLHPLWYALFGVSTLAVLMQRLQVPAQRNWLLALPWFAAGCDAIENRIQAIFLLGDHHITDGLATLSTLASISKWLTVLVFVSAIGYWLLRLVLTAVGGKT